MTCKAYKTIFEKYMEGMLRRGIGGSSGTHQGLPGMPGGVQRLFSRAGIVQDSLNPQPAAGKRLHRPLRIQRLAAPAVSSSYAAFSIWDTAPRRLFSGDRIIHRFPAGQSSAGRQKSLAISISQLQGDVLVKHTWKTAGKN